MVAAMRPRGLVAALALSSAAAASSPLTDDEAAAQLNADYNSDPVGEASPLGVVVHGGSDFTMYCDTPCTQGLEFNDRPEAVHDWSTCRISANLLNRMHSVLPANNVHCSLPPPAPMNRSIVVSGLELGSLGWIYNRSVLDTALACAYASDGNSRFRMNHGCGCLMDQMPDFDKCRQEERPAGMTCSNACMNLDHLTNQSTTPASPIVADCHCHMVGDHMDNRCYWQGPAFYKGTGANEVRRMAMQRVLDPDGSMTCVWKDDGSFDPAGIWNELILSTVALKRQLERDFHGTVAAIAVPTFLNGSLGWTRQQVLQWQSENLKMYNVTAPVPIVVVDRFNLDAPFSALKEEAVV